jgi:hypothetical protein
MKKILFFSMLGISHAGSLIDPFVLVAGPNLFFSKDRQKQDSWIPHYGLEASIWYAEGLSENLKGRLYGIDLGYDWNRHSQSIYFQAQSYLHNPFANDPQNFPLGFSVGPVWNISHQNQKVNLGIQMDVWCVIWGGGGYRYQKAGSGVSPHQYGLMARIPFVD